MYWKAAGWRYRGTRWDLPLLPAPALAGRHSIRQCCGGPRRVGGNQPAACDSERGDCAGAEVGAPGRAFSGDQTRRIADLDSGRCAQSRRGACVGAQFERGRSRRQDHCGVRNSRGQECAGHRGDFGFRNRRVVVRDDSRERGDGRRRTGERRARSRSPPRFTRPTAWPPPALPPLRKPNPRTELWFSAPFIPLGPLLWTGSSADCCCWRRFPNILRRCAQLETKGRLLK